MEVSAKATYMGDTMPDVQDPGREAIDKILNDLEEKAWTPTDVARQSRRLRAHIDGLRGRIEELVRHCRDSQNSDLTDHDFETLGGGTDHDRANAGASG